MPTRRTRHRQEPRGVGKMKKNNGIFNLKKFIGYILASWISRNMICNQCIWPSSNPRQALLSDLLTSIYNYYWGHPLDNWWRFQHHYLSGRKARRHLKTRSRLIMLQRYYKEIKNDRSRNNKWVAHMEQPTW
jgi:hypothetical protein